MGFAVLRANYNAHAANYLDTFQAFVAEALSAISKGDARAVAARVRQSYGLAIPDLVVGKILTNLVRKGQAEGSRRAGYSATERTSTRSSTLEADILKFRRQQATLASKFREYVEKEHPSAAPLLEKDLDEELTRYLQAHAVPLLAQSLSGAVDARFEPDPGFDYLISSFVAHLAERDVIGFGFVEDIVKGAILAAVVTLDTSSFRQSLRSLSIYLDTPVLIDLLGFHGKDSQTAAQQLVSLATNLGAIVCTFEHSVRETTGVLQTAEAWIRTGRGDNIPRTVLHFESEGLSPADILIERERLSDSIRAAGVIIRSKPDTYIAYGLDESELEGTLQRVVHYRNSSARVYDVDSISAIHRLREGGSSDKFERSKAVLATDNTELSKAASQVVSERHQFPLVMTVTALASLLWVRSPTDSNLPRTQLLATAYAGMQPDPRLWQRYVDEVAKLESRGTVSAEEAVILRSASISKAALMEETLGQPEAFNDGATLDVLTRLRDQEAAPVRAALLEEQGARGAAETERDDMAGQKEAAEDRAARLAQQYDNYGNEIERRERERDAKIREEARAFAKRVLIVIVALIGLALGAVALVGTDLNPFGFRAPGWLSPISVTVGALFLLLAGLQSFIPGDLFSWFGKPFEKRIALRRESVIRRRAHLPQLVEARSEQAPDR